MNDFAVTVLRLNDFATAVLASALGFGLGWGVKWLVGVLYRKAIGGRRS